jgi:serine/threonine protein kinase
MLRKGEKIGEYVLLDKVGSGGFGDVWKAEKRTRVDVNHFALKFFRPKDDNFDFDKISKEVSVWKQLRGLPHIISVIELDQFDDYIYVVSDFADGGSLERWLNKNGKASSLDEAVKITLEILTGLDRLHEKGFVHRDIKPDNILITNGSHCLADFGISREIKSHSKATSTAGTLEYMPPEAFAKNASITKQTDIWAVGVILQKLLTGKLPYPQDDQPSLIAAILYSDPEKMPESVPKAFRAIVDKALQKNREDRFPTAIGMYKALQSALVAYQDEGPSAVHPTVPAFSAADTVTEFNDLETIRIDRLSLADNPTVRIESKTSMDSIVTRESVVDSVETVPAAAAVVMTGPPVAKNKEPLWTAALLVVGILTVGGIAGAVWLKGPAPADANSGATANANSSSATVIKPTPAPTLAPTPEETRGAAKTSLPNVLPTPMPTPKNMTTAVAKPQNTPRSIPAKPAPSPKVVNSPKPAKDLNCMFNRKC